MKKLCAWALAVLILTGCSQQSAGMERAMDLRSKLLGCTGCTFDASVTADYGDAVHKFSMTCQGDSQGNLTFTVTEPETLSGITGAFTAGEGKLTFDDAALAFPLLADDQVTPVSGPWIFFKTLLSGNLTACGEDGEYLRVTIDDSYEDDALQLDIWLNAADVPLRAEIGYGGRRILSMDIGNLEIS